MLENRIFTGGLDQDSSDELIANGDYPYALNCRVSTVGNIGQITNSKGTIEITTQLPSGTNMTIGSFQNKETKKLYYFLYNSNNEHTVYEFDGQNITVVLTTPLFGFDPNYKITGVTMIGNLLFWTDNLNESMVVDVERGKAGQYIAPYKIEYFTQIRKPPLNPPTSLYSTDAGQKFNVNNPNSVFIPARRSNYLRNKLFQFKTRYVYSDNSKSVTSPVSEVPFPGSSCGNTSEVSNNIINIKMETGCTEVTKIELMFREGNEGDFYLIDTFIKAENQPPIQSDSFFTYTWANDGIYNTIPLNESIQLYDDIPQTYKALDLIPGNRIARANGTHQFDQVDVKASMVVDYQETASSEETFNITGTVFIKNPFSLGTLVSGNPYANYQPITKRQQDTYAVFGGYGPLQTTLYGPHAESAEQPYGQILPLNGFVVYLAGTSYHAITEQVNIDSLATTLTNGVYTNDSNAQHKDIRKAIEADHVFSTFTINNVPKGTYILRVAGGRMANGQPMTQADLAGTEYQNSSTYTIQVGGQEGYEYVVSGTTGTVHVEPTFICDLIDIKLGTQSCVIDGYVVDRNQPTLTGVQLLNNDRIEKAVLDIKRREAYSFALFPVPLVGQFLAMIALLQASFSVLGNLIYNSISNNIVLNHWGQGRMVTDHNGFFFFAYSTIIGGGGVNRGQVLTVAGSSGAGFTQAKSFNQDIYDEAGNNVGSDFHSTGDRRGYILQNYNNEVTDNTATHLQGYVVDASGNGIANVTVISTGTNRHATTGADGSYHIRVWGDLGVALNQNNRSGQVIFMFTGQCFGSLSPDTAPYTVPAFDLPIPPTGVVYNNNSPSNDYLIAEKPTLTFLSDTKCAFKHGGTYRFGIVYADQFGRLSTTMTNDWKSDATHSLKVNIPFELDGGGMTGIPSLRMSIFSYPPAWASKYYIVRTKNTAMNYYLRFLVNNVTYVDDNKQTTSPGSGSQILLNFYNIPETTNGSFASRFSGSLISLSFVKGMRVRLISDAGGNYYNGYWDMEVKGHELDAALEFSVDNIGSMPIIQNGSLVEVYVPKLVAKEQIFYEVAAAGDVIGGYHMGINGQNQSATQEAIAKVPQGDTYYRVRNMPYYPSSGAVTQYPDPTTLRKVLIESPSYSDFYDLAVQDIGRPNVVDKNVKKTQRPSTIWYSGQYIRDTFINRLCNVPLTAFEDYPEQHGAISKLYSGVASGDNMGSNIVDVYQTNRVGSILVDEFAATSSSSQQGILVGTTSVLSKTAKYYQGEIGLSNPESFAHYSERRYFADSSSQQVGRLSNDGIEPISEYKMSAYFFDKLEYLRNGQCTVCAGYDTENMEYVLSFSKIALTNDKSEIIETPFNLPVTNGEFTAMGAWDEGALSNMAGSVKQLQNLGEWSIPAPQSWNTPGTFFYDYFVNVTPSYNPNDKAFFTLNPGAYIQGDSAELMSFDTFYDVGTTYKIEMKFDNLSFGTGLTNRVIGLRIKLGDTISDLITSSSTNVADYSGVIVTRNLEATGFEPKLSIIAEVATDIYVEGPEYTWFVAVDYVRVLSTVTNQFTPGTFLPAETLTFNESDNRWKSFWSFYPEWMDSFGVKLVSWVGGQLQIHNVNNSYGNFYGIFYPAQLDVVGNAEAMKVKTLLTIGENATHPWEAYEITTEADDMHPNGQLSESAFQDFVMKEGVYYAPVLRDALTPNIANPLIQGEPMKGRTAKFKLKNIMQIFTKMFTFNINWIASERSNQ